jgi:hypothetical protein
MQTLPDYTWRIGYSSNEHNPILEFYIPALERFIFAMGEGLVPVFKTILNSAIAF